MWTHINQEEMMNSLIAGSFGVVWMVVLVLLLGAVTGFAFRRNTPGNKVLTERLSEPLDGAKAAVVEINSGDGNLTIDRLSHGEPVLASGTMEYLEKQGPPTHILSTSDGQAKFTLQRGESGQPWFRLPWAACNGATETQIHLNPDVLLDITAHSDGGNVKLDLAGMSITRVLADTGGGNMVVILPDDAANQTVAAKSGAGNVAVEIGNGASGSSTVNANSGAGNVTVLVPSGLAARIHARSGLGKVIVDARFSKIDDDTYQSAEYDSAANRVEIELHSGAGNVSVNSK
jgi:hypothetical protein